MKWFFDFFFSSFVIDSRIDSSFGSDGIFDRSHGPWEKFAWKSIEYYMANWTEYYAYAYIINCWMHPAYGVCGSDAQQIYEFWQIKCVFFTIFGQCLTSFGSLNILFPVVIRELNLYLSAADCRVQTTHNELFNWLKKIYINRHH